MGRVLSQLTAARKGRTDAEARARNGLRSLWSQLAWALWPTRCLGCAEAPVAGFGLALCGPCRATLWPNDGPRCTACDAPLAQPFCAPRRAPPACACALRALQRRLGKRRLVGCRAPYRYAGPLARAIVRGKYHGAFGVFVALGARLADDAEVRQLARSADGVTYVPTTASRAQSRGYDTAALLAHALARRLGLPVSCTLRRTDQDASRSLRSGASRRQRPPTFVACAEPSKHVLLVDDVCTTGTTLAAAVSVLLGAGATRIAAVVAARRA